MPREGPPPERVARLVRASLDEDIGAGDLTTAATVPEGARACGLLIAKQELVVAGLDVALAAFRALDPAAAWQPEGSDGDRFFPGTVIGAVSGRARALLTAERVALNFLQRLSGVATLTRRFVDAVAGTGARVRDTRKTTPQLRFLEKYAVEVGGGVPHRAGLDARPTGPGPRARAGARKKKPAGARAPAGEEKCGSDLLSHTASRAVPSALVGLTTVFGMGTGVTPPI